jgi:hypothetical protein
VWLKRGYQVRIPDIRIRSRYLEAVQSRLGLLTDLIYKLAAGARIILLYATRWLPPAQARHPPTKIPFLRHYWDLYFEAYDQDRTGVFYTFVLHKYIDRYGFTLR